MQNKKAFLKAIREEIDQEKLMMAVNSCPVNAISFSGIQDANKNANI